jgi:hypothetical protein
MGYALSYQLTFFNDAAVAPWYRPLSVLQQHVLSLYTNERVSAFNVLARNATSDTLTNTSFDTVHVLRVTDDTLHPLNDRTMAPQGFELQLQQGAVSLRAGAYVQVLNRALNSSCGRQEHVVLLNLTDVLSHSVDLYHLIGCSTVFPVATPCSSGVVSNVTISTYNVEGQFLDNYPGRFNTSTSLAEVDVVTRDPQQPVAISDVDRYRVQWQC